MAQTERFLEISWQVLPGELTPDAAFEKTGFLPESSDLESGPRSGLHTILEIARRLTKEHRDVRNFECERFTDGPRKGWKDKSKLKRDAKLDNAGAAWSALYRKVNWELDAVRRTRAWKAWADGGWSAGREQNKDSLNGREEAVLDLSGDEWSDTRVEALNEQSGVVNLFKKGEILGASSLIKRLWPSAWLEPEHGFKQGDWRMPDTRRIAEGQPFKRDTEDDQFDADADETADDDKPIYFAVLALDGDEMGKWVSGTHPRMPSLGDQLSDYRLRDERKGARVYLEQNALGDLLKRKRPLNPSYHLQFSEMLANFSNFCVRRIVESFDGRLIYSGGDDVLAMLPATTALACATALRAAFRGEPEVLNALTGAWRVRLSGSEKDNTAQLFRCEQPGFIQLERTLRQKGFALEGEPGKFAAMVPGPAADASVGIAIAHFKSPLQDVVGPRKTPRNAPRSNSAAAPSPSPSSNAPAKPSSGVASGRAVGWSFTGPLPTRSMPRNSAPSFPTAPQNCCCLTSPRPASLPGKASLWPPSKGSTKSCARSSGASLAPLSASKLP